MKKTTPEPKAPATEPKTSIGNFYRAHRTEVLAGGGIAVALFAYWKSKSSNSSTAAATAATAASSNSLPVDPNAGGISGGAGSTYSGGGSNGGYGASNNALLTQLLGMATTPGQGLLISNQPPPVTPSTGTDPVTTSPQVNNGMPPLTWVTPLPMGTSGTPPTPVTQPTLGPAPAGSKSPGSPSAGGSGRTLAQSEAITSANLAKYRAQVAKDPTARNRAAVTALSHRLTAERAA